MPGFKLDRLDVDALDRIMESSVWQEYQARITDRLASCQRTCCNGAIEDRELRVAQGEVAALRFVLALPDAIQKEIVRRTSDAK